jgi:hypothetical protein
MMAAEKLVQRRFSGFRDSAAPGSVTIPSCLRTLAGIFLKFDLIQFANALCRALGLCPVLKAR